MNQDKTWQANNMVVVTIYEELSSLSGYVEHVNCKSESRGVRKTKDYRFRRDFQYLLSCDIILKIILKSFCTCDWQS